MPRTRIGPVVIVAGLTFAACTDADASPWASEADAICSDVASTWSTLDPNDATDADRQLMRSELRGLARRLAALDGANGAAVEAVEGLESVVAAMDADEVPTDIGWVEAFQEAGAESCWSLFSGSPSDSTD